MNKAEDIMDRIKDIQSGMEILLDFWRHNHNWYLEKLYIDLGNRIDLKIENLRYCIKKIKRRRSIQALLKNLEDEIMRLENARDKLNPVLR